jgi:hypothetical protein
MKQIRALRSGLTNTSYPRFWSLTTEKFSVTAGTQYVLALYPDTDGIHKLHYGYTIEPDKPTEDAHYFIGGALASECILECALAEAEVQEDDVVGIHDTRAKELIHTCIEKDLRRAPTAVGMVTAHTVFWNDPRLAQDLRWINATGSVYGQTSS